eukprot:NODE_173_length_15916_cov_0.397673.p4 type:complete len:410 gc:universal NODE_173_length_15916_cov_0.397673:8936-7707(-)
MLFNGFSFIRYEWRWFFLVAFGIFSYDGTLGMLMPLLPLFLKRLDMGEELLGLPLLVFGIGWLVGSVLFAYLMEIYRRRKVFLVAAYVILSVYGVSMAFLVDKTEFFLLLALQGFGEGLVWQLGLLIVSELFDKDKQAIFNGYLFAAFNTSTIISPVISSFIFNSYSVVGYGTSAAVLGTLGFITSIFCPENLNLHKLIQHEKMDSVHLFHPAYISGIYLAFLSAGVRAAFESLISIILRDRFHIQDQYIGTYFLNITIPATVACLLMGHLSKIVSEYILLWLGLCLLLISTYLILLSKSLLMMCFGLVILSIGFVFTSSPVPSYLCQVLKVHPSSLHGSFNFFTALGIAVFPFTSGYIMSIGGPLWTSLFITITLLVVTPFLYASWKYSVNTFDSVAMNLVDEGLETC